MNTGTAFAMAEGGEHSAMDETGFRRLVALQECGYRIDFPLVETGSVFLDHPSNFRGRSLFLWADGRLKGMVVEDELWIGADEHGEFDSFVAKVPIPTLWDRYSRVWISVLVFGGLGLFGWLASLTIEAVTPPTWWRTAPDGPGVRLLWAVTVAYSLYMGTMLARRGNTEKQRAARVFVWVFSAMMFVVAVVALFKLVT
jgi:hypothetical protein